MRLELAVDIPSDVDDLTLSFLLAAKNSGHGITVMVPGAEPHTHAAACSSVHIDVDLVDVERVVEFIDDTSEGSCGHETLP